MSGFRCEAALTVAAEAAESLAAEFVECRAEHRRSERPWLSSHRIFRPRNCGAAADTLRATGQVQDDPRLSRLSNTFYLQRDRSTTNAERAPDLQTGAHDYAAWSALPLPKTRGIERAPARPLSNGRSPVFTVDRLAIDFRLSVPSSDCPANYYPQQSTEPRHHHALHHRAGTATAGPVAAAAMRSARIPCRVPSCRSRRHGRRC